MQPTADNQRIEQLDVLRGLALLGIQHRAELYPLVVAIWALQLLWSPWWLQRFRFGPLEWLWRALTYGQRPPLRRR